jgi:hypothetical protein
MDPQTTANEKLTTDNEKPVNEWPLVGRSA